MAIFLVGAYQEILGDMHNLFGHVDSVDVHINTEGGCELSNVMPGETVTDVLQGVNFDVENLLTLLKKGLSGSACAEHVVNDDVRTQLLNEYRTALKSYTYLKK